MEIESVQVPNTNILPLELSLKYFQKWDCDVQTILSNSLYYKCLTGLGQVTFLNGNFYKGGFKRGLMHGKGTYLWKNGIKYEGTFIDNVPKGKGVLTWNDGSWYKGQVQNGLRHGQGEYHSKKDNSTYQGQWFNGFKQGKGTLTFQNGAIYQGQFSKGLRNGTGKMRYPSGNQYEGTWSNDKKQGKGVMNWLGQGQKYCGEWVGDLPEGEGEYIWYQGRGEGKIVKTVFKGMWREGRRQGIGAFYYNNGCRLEGYFRANLKEGICAITDQLGDTHIQHYHNDKSTQKQSLHSTLTTPLPQQPKAMILNTQPTDNIYSKMSDITSVHLTQSIFNLLLRHNSQLRTNYKLLINNANKQIFNGLNIEGLWRVVKDMNVTHQGLNLALINRKFYQGSKSMFQTQIPSMGKMMVVQEKEGEIKKYRYQDIEWERAMEKYRDTALDWNYWPQKMEGHKIEEIQSRGVLQVHNQDHIILYRHFITYILHLALMQHEQQSLHSSPAPQFRKVVSQTISSLTATLQQAKQHQTSFKTFKACSQVHTNVSHSSSRLGIPEQYAKVNQDLLKQINSDRDNLIKRNDQTITVRQLYTLLVKCGLLKQANQKMLFLQRVERGMQLTNPSLLKKDNKHLYSAFEKVVLTSAQFSHIMNYQMIGSQFDQILFKLLNRKIGNTLSKEEFMKKYKEIVKNMVNEVSRHKQEQKNSKKSVGFKWDRISSKDKQRQQLLRQVQEERKRREQEQRKQNQLRRQTRERRLMEKEDRDVKDEEQSENSQEYYD